MPPSAERRNPRVIASIDKPWKAQPEQVDVHIYCISPVPPATVQVKVCGPEAALYSLGPGEKSGGGSPVTVMLTVRPGDE